MVWVVRLGSVFESLSTAASDVDLSTVRSESLRAHQANASAAASNDTDEAGAIEQLGDIELVSGGHVGDILVEFDVQCRQMCRLENVVLYNKQTWSRSYLRWNDEPIAQSWLLVGH